MLFRRTVILLTIVAITGCGGSHYEERFESSLTNLRKEAPFSSLWPDPIRIPLSIDGQNILLQVRIPRVFDTKTKEAYALDQNTPEPRNPKVEVYAERLRPSFLQFGTHLRTYEVTLNFKDRAGKDKRSSIRCFLSVMPRNKEVDSHGILSKRITEKLKEAFNENTVLTTRQTKANPTLKSGVGEWIALSVPTPNGEQREVERIEAFGNIQLPSYIAPGKPATQNKTILATCLLYIVRIAEETVVLSWLLPVDLAAQKNIDVPAVRVPIAQLPVARAMAGTVQAKIVAPNANEDTNEDANQKRD